MPVRHLDVILRMPSYFDAHERRLVIMSIVVGMLTWALVFLLKLGVHAGFDWMIHTVHGFSTPWIILVPLIIGSLIVATIAGFNATYIHYRDKRGTIHQLIDVEGDGLERAIGLYYSSEPVLEQTLLGKEGVDVRWELPTLSLALRKFVATIVTLSSGGSGGLEASVALIGESTAAALFKPRRQTILARVRPASQLWGWWRSTNPDDLQTAQLAGVGAAISTLLGTPLAAAFFATEIMYRRRPVVEKLLYALIAALTAFSLSNVVTGGHSHLFEPAQIITPPHSTRYYLIIALMAITVALIDAYFSRARDTIYHGFHKYIPNIWLRHTSGAILTGLIAIVAFYLTGHGIELIVGTGENIINEALAGTLTLRVALIALIAKLYATLATVGAGGSAGLLIPSIFFGSMTGVLFSQLFGLPAMTVVVPAMTASLVAIVNVPLAAILFTVELFGSIYLLPALLTLVITLLFAHENSIYRTQRERDERREIMPGYSVRRVVVPPVWAGHTLIDLALRDRYEVNVIGQVQSTPAGSRILPSVATRTPLRQDDLLIVMGENESLNRMQSDLQQAMRGRT